jgi:TolB-like protein
MNVAVLDFDARAGLTAEEAMTLSDVVQANIVNMGEFIVVDRARIRQILEEQGFQQSEACSQVECIVEAGKILRVEKMIAGTIGKIGSLFNISIQVVDVATAQIQSTKSRQYSGDIEDIVQEIVPELSNEIATEMLGRPPRNLVETSGGGGWIWYVLGTVVVGGGAVAAGMFLTQSKDDEPPVTESRDLPTPPVLP